MRFSLLFAVGLAATCLAHRASAQVACPPAGIETDPPYAANPSGTPNNFNWYYGDYQPGTWNGRMYSISSSADPSPNIYLPWQQPDNINMARFNGQNDVPANGWQLIKRDLGYSNSGAVSPTKNPYVIIYNKRLGVLRVFITIQQALTNFQFAEVKLLFNSASGYKAATLNRQSALGVALEDTEPNANPAFTVVAKFINTGGKWFVADFPMDYDPCVCQFDSRLQIEVSLIKKSTITLQGTSTGSIVTSQDEDNGTKNGPSFFKNVNGAINAAGTSYDNVEKFSKQLKAEGAVGSVIDNFAKSLKDNKFLQNGLAAIPYVGAAVGLLDFFIGGGQDSTPQPIALQPLSINMTTNTTGTIEDVSLYATPYFQNPGNRVANTLPESIPAYNEAMGVLSILKRPVIDFTTKTTTSGTRADLTRETYQEYRLTNDLAYTINPAAGLEVVEFQAAILAEGGSDPQQAPQGDFSNLEGTTVGSDGKIHYIYRTDYFDAKCLKNNKFVWQAIVQPSSGTNMPPPRDITVKLMLNLRSINGNSSTQNVLLVARYPVTKNLVSSLSRIPAATCGVLPQATQAAIQAVCSSTKYQQGIALRGSPVVKAGATQPASGVAQLLVAYPNPASSNITFNFTTVQSGRVRLSLNDALGREVRKVLDEDKSISNFQIAISTTDLQPGVYYCLLNSLAGQTVQKIVIAP